MGGKIMGAKRSQELTAARSGLITRRTVRATRQAEPRPGPDLLVTSAAPWATGTLAVSLVGTLLLGVSRMALAQCTGAADSTTCAPGGNPYASGINLSAGLAQALRLAMYEP